MARLIIVVLFLFVRPSLAADPWTKAQIGQQVAFTVLLAADWSQTRSETDLPPEQRQFYETNPILGRYPSTDEVDTYFAAVAVGHALVSHALPSKWRNVWQYVWIARESYSVVNNYRIGVELDF